MKQYLILGFAFILLLLSLLLKNKSFAYNDCSYSHIYPKEITTNNLEEYLSIMNYKEVYGFCSYDYCYNIKELKISKSIQNFKTIYDKRVTDDTYFELYVKGYPITEIIVNCC